MDGSGLAAPAPILAAMLRSRTDWAKYVATNTYK